MQDVTPRREFLRLTLAAGGLIALSSLGLERFAAHAATAPERLTRACEILKAIVLEHAQARDNPWLLIHGLRAMGKDFTVDDEPAVAYLCRRHLREKTVDGKSYLYMPITDEGHTNVFLSEAVLDVGIDLAYVFRTNDRDYTVADLVAGAKALFTFDARSNAARAPLPITFNPDDLAWSLIVFAYTTNPEQDHWINAYGEHVRFSDVVEFGMNTLDRATTKFQATMRKGLLADEPDGIHGFTCGGIHLIYGLSTCLRFGHMRNALAERMKLQFDILIWRLESDSRFIDRYYRAIAGQYPPEMARMYLLNAKLKFLGHAFEVINHAHLFGLFAPTPAQEEIVGTAQKELFDLVDALGQEDVGKFVGDEVLFKLLVGDACHAYHGLTMISEA